MHPHTHWVLKQPVAKYVLDPHPVYLKHSRPTASDGAAPASAAASGSPSGPSGDVSGQGTNMEADTATQPDASPDTHTPRIPPHAFSADVHQSHNQQPHSRSQRQDAQVSQAADLNIAEAGACEQATPALSGFSASQQLETPGGSEPYTPAGNFVSTMHRPTQSVFLHIHVTHADMLLSSICTLGLHALLPQFVPHNRKRGWSPRHGFHRSPDNAACVFACIVAAMI